MGLLKRLFGYERQKKGHIPEGVWVAAIGDVHGQLDELSALLAKVEGLASQSVAVRKILVFVGDYIDRGLKSRQVVDRLLAGFPGFETHFLKGNHDETLLQFLDDPVVADAWKNYGGLETLASYGVQPRTKTGDWRDVQEALKDKLPVEHLRFFQNLELSFVLGDYLFVHAGLRPGIPLDAQSPHDMMWIRDDFLNSSADFGRIVVHGHTPKSAPEVKANRIGIDTGAYMTRVLTALILEGETKQFVKSRDI
jgi:serine/threonine protein phosphatase 1